MNERRSAPEMLDEMLREVATLVVVFVPLDASVKTLTLKKMIATVVLSGILFAAGVLFEV